MLYNIDHACYQHRASKRAARAITAHAWRKLDTTAKASEEDLAVCFHSNDVWSEAFKDLPEVPVTS